ncbi:helix-turn-helix transcriptional regulator [Flintibacter sp. KGMB00164]|uniref:helix-turn-helix domain-containing protein n=1 Tax=Flintibacter sp. KGMB00164 TaxID=2610895 RepID=UPI001245B2BF|nr:helix-turn-helix transcriptional regulator [Flintibacter sp. KGMB00164]
MDASTFVQNVKYLCLKKGIKPTNACKDAGVGGSFLSDILNRGSTPSVAKVQMLANYLGVTTSELLGETKKPTVQDDGLTEAEQALMDLFRQLTPDQQDMVIRMVQAAADKQ